MPKRTDIKKILIIGSGPIVISQACEFDYSGAQACKALKEEGFKIVLLNSNPATIMTDPEMADSTYIEPITVEVLEKIIEKEKPDVLLPTLGGQTGLNTAMKAAEAGILDKHNVKMIGADYDAIRKAEDREYFKKAMSETFRVSSAHALLSLPDANRAYRLYIQIPKLGLFKKLIQIPRLQKAVHHFDGQHYWEIGKVGYSLNSIVNAINKVGFKIEKTYRVFEMPYHRFFMLKKIKQ